MNRLKGPYTPRRKGCLTAPLMAGQDYGPKGCCGPSTALVLVVAGLAGARLARRPARAVLRVIA